MFIIRRERQIKMRYYKIISGPISKVCSWRHPYTNKQYLDSSRVSENSIQFYIPGRLIQDGGVEGCVLTPSCESNRITTNCWVIIDRKTLELTKKETQYPKTKEKPHWNCKRGAITIKSNPITAEWVTHKLENDYTTELHPMEWRFWAPNQASQPGGLATGGRIPRESDFEG